MKKPLILLSNDDGYLAKGVNTLAEWLSAYGEVVAICPDSPRSAQSMAITVNQPLFVTDLGEKNGVKWYRTNGTPVDCIKLAMHVVLKGRRPDLVVAGINHGSNAAVNVLYSGTMGAALEGCAFGLPAIGFSLTDHSPNADFSVCRPFVEKLVGDTLKNGLPEGVCLNVNIPDSPQPPKEMRLVRACRGYWNDEYREYTDPFGRTFYWIQGDFINEEPDNPDTDEWCIHNDRVSVVPILLERTAPGAQVPEWLRKAIPAQTPGWLTAATPVAPESRTNETVLEVNLDSIVKNFNYFKEMIPKETGVIAMVKASGYGAGSYEIAKTMQDCGAAYVAVAVLDEGIDLRRAGITMPVMVFNPKVENYKEMFRHNLEPEIYSLEMLADVIREAQKFKVKGYPVHIKLDTGMHRMGFVESELRSLMDMLTIQDNIVAKSVFSHLATADCLDMDDYTLHQLERFDKWSQYMIERYDRPILRHVLNSAGIIRFPQYHYDMVRLGIGLYGANTLPPEIEKPLAVVSTLRTEIIAIRDREAGDTVGYGRRGVLERRSRIATIPVGYADGMSRRFGCGKVSVFVGGKMAPTVGNICMDACMIDVTGIDCKVGDVVEIFGNNAPIQRMADAGDTIPYEILTSVSPRVKRLYVKNIKDGD